MSVSRSICIIPARGGSKRIPRKNIKLFYGKPIIEYAIDTARRSGVFANVMVSTDDVEIAQIARNAGAAVPFLRSAACSDDRATTMDVLHEVLMRYKEEGEEYSQVCCLYPISPLVFAEDLWEGEKGLQYSPMGCVMPIVQYGHPIWRGLGISLGEANYLWPEKVKAPTQELPTVYHDAGQWYWLHAKHVVDKRKFDELVILPVIKSEMDVQDVDSAEDWQLLEIKYSIQRNRAFDSE